jgi:hypothetical protein
VIELSSVPIFAREVAEVALAHTVGGATVRVSARRPVRKAPWLFKNTAAYHDFTLLPGPEWNGSSQFDKTVRELKPDDG